MRLRIGVVFIAGVLLIGVVLPLAMLQAGWVNERWLAYGAIAWIIAVLVKMGGSFGIQLQLYTWKVPVRGRAAVSGFWSALCELGAIGYLLWTPHPYPSWQDALSLGVGAGAFEALALGVAGVAALLNPDEPTPEQAPWAEMGLSLVERLIALVGHIASRGLVWIGFMGGPHALWLLPALAFFTWVDGLAAYGQEAGWDFQSQAVLRRFYTWVGLVTLLELVVFAVAFGVSGAGASATPAT